MSSYVDGDVFARRTISCGSAPCSAPGSPKSRVKFLVSHGGKILPRPSDGQLKYVGGETRVISVARDISFQELMKRLTYLIDGEMILKYQLATEDLDALVTVKSEEDLVHMFDEMEHYQMMGFPRMRTFLFPVNHVVMDEQLPLDQRYIFSINGIVSPVRHLPNPNPNYFNPSPNPNPNYFNPNPSPNPNPNYFNPNPNYFNPNPSPNPNPNYFNPNPSKHIKSVASSACTSPRSPDSCATEGFNSEALPYINTHQNMHKVQSSPSICNLIIPQQQSNHYSYHQLPPQHYHNSPTPHHDHSGYRSPNPAPCKHGGRPDGVRFQPDCAPPSYYYPSRDHNRGGTGYCTIGMHHDNCSNFSDKRLIDRRFIDRQGTLP